MGATDQRRVRYFVDLRQGRFPARRLEGDEGLSRPFRAEVAIVIPDPDAVDPDALAGDRVSLILAEEDEGLPVELRRVVVVVSEAVLVATARGNPELVLVLEAPLSLLRHGRDTRAFVDHSAPEIVAVLCDEASIGCRLRLEGSYEKRAYSVQYRETDLDFLSRILEDEGIFHACFDERDGTPTFGDSVTAYECWADIEALALRPGAGLEHHAAAILTLRRRSTLGAREVRLGDWNPERPSLDLEVGVPGPSPQGARWYDYPGKYELPAQGERKARLLAEAMAMEASRHEGTSNCALLAPGRVFGVEGQEDRWVVTRLRHRFHDGEPFVVSFEAQPARRAYRPPHRAPRPVLTSPITGFVTGPADEDIHTDAMGRVKVRFPWDRRAPEDDTASGWIPVLQDNTGHSLGIPRVGWEVLVHFVDGDPDRPVVMGRVYNGADPFPEPLPANKTMTALRSVTSPGAGGANVIRFEDKAGAEQVYVQAQKDQNVVVANDKHERVAGVEESTIGGDETVTIGGSLTVDVGKDRGSSIERDQSWAVRGSRLRKVADTDAVNVNGKRSVAIAGAHLRRVDEIETVRAARLSESVGAVNVEASLLPNRTNAGRALLLGVGGAHIELTGKSKSEKVTGVRMENVGALLYTAAGDEIVLKSKTTRTTRVGGALRVSASGWGTLHAGGELEATALDVDVGATASLTLMVGDNQVVVEKGKISVHAPGKGIIQILADDAGLLHPPKALLNETPAKPPAATVTDQPAAPQEPTVPELPKAALGLHGGGTRGGSRGNGGGAERHLPVAVVGAGTAEPSAGGGGPASGPPTGMPAAPERPGCERAEEVKQKFQLVIQRARSFGLDVAADVLHNWLVGGGDMRMPVDWLLSYPQAKNAEKAGLEDAFLVGLALKLADGQTDTYKTSRTASINDGFWKLTGGFQQIYWAGAQSYIRAQPDITLVRHGDLVEVSGTVHYHWYDHYNFDAGKGLLIPVFPFITTDDIAFPVERCCGAKAFEMWADWRRTVHGTVDRRRALLGPWLAFTSGPHWSAPQVFWAPVGR
jgi:type VI secretion system secreted protein VgrG